MRAARGGRRDLHTADGCEGGGGEEREEEEDDGGSGSRLPSWWGTGEEVGEREEWGRSPERGLRRLEGEERGSGLTGICKDPTKIVSRWIKRDQQLR